MCAPAVIAYVAVTAAATGVGLYAQKRKNDAEEELANNNAVIAGYQRGAALQQGAYAARRTEIEGRHVAASALAATSVNGVDSSVGSPAAAITASGINAGIDASTIKANAARAAWGYEAQQQDILTQKRINKQAGYLGMLNTGISGLGSAVAGGASLNGGSGGESFKL